ncbi:MAG: chemotaxis protein [Proteobacteria bacterium]|nr:chemotaxis protein [Pseudomonadota bacterium]
MKLSTRLGIVVACSMFGLLVLGGMGLHSLRTSMMEERYLQIDNLLKMSVSLVNRYYAQESSGKMSHADAQGAAINALMGLQNGNAYVFIRNDQNVILAHIRPDRIGKVDSVNAAAYSEALAKQGKYAFVEIMLAKPGADVKNVTPKLNGVTRFEPWGWTVATGFFLDDIDAKYKVNAAKIFGVGLFLLFVTSALTIFYARKIYRQLGGEPDYCAEITRDIAAGHLDKKIKTAPKDSVLAGLSDMQKSLSVMIGNVLDKAESVKYAAMSIQATMQEISTASAHSSEATSSTAAAIEEMVVSVSMIDENARETENNSAQATELARLGEAQVVAASNEIQEISTKIKSASSQVTGLAERISQIGSVANVIRDIADQTNLLALNAAIEAARAGEQGRGFAVVADEVRKLAERTSLATNEIAKTIKAVQEDTSCVVTSMEEVAPQIARGMSMAGEAAQSLQGINRGAEATLTKIRDVVHATAEQTSASNSIAANVEKIAAMLEEADKSVQGATDSVRSLSVMARDIHEAVARFHVAPR